MGNGNNLSAYDNSIISLVSSWKVVDDILAGLISQDVVHRTYSVKCLEMDMWYLSKNAQSVPSIQRECTGLEEFEQRLLFQVVVQSLIDVYSNRPCDDNIWGSDLSSDFRKCTSNLHICARYAETYIEDLGLELDSYIGLSNGCLSDLVREIKKRR